MIVKVSRSKAKSSYKRLINYILSPEKEKEIKYINISNLSNDDYENNGIESSIEEVKATQNLSKKTTADKTHHIIVSFPINENPSNKILKDIEENLIKSINYENHQRIAVVHTDTSHIHMHIAVNKIHPETYRNITTGRTYNKLQTIARELEIKHGLQKLKDHKIDNKKLEGIILESRESRDWQILHKKLADINFSIRKSGRGLSIFLKTTGESIKPSEINRDFSKTKLEVIFGEFEPNKKPKTKEKIKDKEILNKTISFHEWAKEILEPIIQESIENDNNWDKLHEKLADKGLQIIPRGRGLIIIDKETSSKNKYRIKPSEINRDFSKVNLEKN